MILGGVRYSCNIYLKLLAYIPAYYTFLCGFTFMVAAIVNFYYFRTYGNKIDVFIFGLKDDDTLAILSIMWQDYPLVIGIICALIFGIFCSYLYKIPYKIYLKNILRITPHRFYIIRQMSGQLLLIILLVIAARGSLGTFPLKEDNYSISPLPIFNHLAANPLMAFAWAMSNYEQDSTFTPPSLTQGESLQQKLFPLLRVSADSAIVRDNPPHIVLNLMESFGTNLLVYDDKENNDLLGALRQHFEEDFVFYRFLSGANGTAGSFAALFFDSPTAQIALGKYKTTALALNPFKLYANAGYEVIYITSGYASWQGFGAFISLQGAHHIYDATYLMKHFPQSKADKSAYGVSDEYIYKLALEILNNATKPTFIAMLTTSNHPPFHLPRTYVPKPITLPDTLLFLRTYESQEKMKTAALLYQYANDTFGYFMNMLKASPLAQNTIVAASGDHRLRDFNSNTSTDKALYYAVPLYMYVPPRYTSQIHYDSSRVGSHKDILPTLYDLSLPHTTYISIGGRNILSKDDDERYAFGFNQLVWIDKDGIYPIPTEVGYKWADSAQSFGLLSTNESFILNEKKKQFAQEYKELFDYSIRWRIFDMQDSSFE
ncbi:LTA synthase family protein [uncultured Helicobacter sp.]|uniref:LTA synthase family protein n=1 Tax=uncultured Helicobacter sp. TaxID=175537 RepID=UPI0026186059|nr:LTA synthase family protein [uncultured Helicobacter sp.]